MKVLFGILLILGGLTLGAYVGVYLMLVGGIVEIVNGATSNPVDAGDIAWGAVRIVFANIAGVFAAFVMIAPGFAMFARWLNRR